ncbi:MAG: Bax inhibitor-1 family protein [Myxococcota bacterium]
MSSDFQISQAYQPVAAIGVDARASFINRTYNHLMGAIVLFTLIEVGLFQSGLAESIAQVLLGGSWLLVLGAFMLVNWFASRVSLTSESKGAQYAALGGFVVAESIIFVPMLWLANQYAPGAIQSAAIVTLVGFAGLTAVAFVTRKDFSFLRGIAALRLGGADVLVRASAVHVERRLAARGGRDSNGRISS